MYEQGKQKQGDAGKPKAAGGTKARAKSAPRSEPKSESKPAPKGAAKRPGRARGAAKEEAKPAAPARREAPARPVVRAQAKYVRSSARKARLVMDHVRGKPVSDARALLRHSPRGIARDLDRLLASAVANAENNHDLVGDDLYVKEIYADEGPTLRRFRPRALGRATRIRKRTTHLTVALSTKE
jgi:ribosomal protein L22